MAKLKVAVLISGRGSNLAALIEACRAADFPAEIVLVLSNRAEAAGLTHAQAAAIAVRIITHKGWPEREAFDRAMSAALEQAGTELICMAGFMRIFSPWFVAHWQDRIVNIHPSLLPAFKGLHPHRQALDAGVHFVTTDLDGGPIIAQAAVPVSSDDDEEALSARILTAEHRLYPMVLRWFGERRVRLVRSTGAADRVDIVGLPPDVAALFQR